MTDKINVFETYVPNCLYSSLWSSARVEPSNSERMITTVANKTFLWTKQQYLTKRGREEWSTVVNKRRSLHRLELIQLACKLD